MEPRRTPLPTRAKEAFAELQPVIEAHPSGLPRDDVEATLVAANFQAAEAADVVEILVQRGYLYVVDGLVRVT